MVNMLSLEKRAKLKRAIAEKIPTRHAAVIFHYDNARQDWLKAIWKLSGWEVLSQPPYSMTSCVDLDISVSLSNKN